MVEEVVDFPVFSSYNGTIDYICRPVKFRRGPPMIFSYACSKIGRPIFFQVVLTFFLLTGTPDFLLGQSPPIPKFSEVVDPKVAECLATGRQAMDKGDLQEALSRLSTCAQDHPKSAIVHYSLGMLYFLSHHAEKATAEFKKALELDPDNPYVIGMLGRMYSFDSTKTGVARELLERALAINPAIEDARFDLARVYAQQGDLEKSFTEFAILLSGEEKFAVYHTELAKILRSVNQSKEAREQLQKALILKPNFELAKKLLNDLETEKSIESRPLEEKGQKSN